MDSKKAILLFSILVMVLHIFSMVSARNLSGTSTNIKEEVGGSHGGGGGGYGGHRVGGGYHGGGRYGRRRNRGSYCHNGCCDGLYANGCGRCCSYTRKVNGVHM
ncbi:glycine-rich protein DC7.1-like isoform X3 [Vicia villosa]|uniref:glycine-rich protein DC7.1-like isoform X3 n=1 Tax=Vicia villosa TaxID=3911 RepID=UPI00273B2C3D|nr:glycine-rich protein DC7.1-like isoform X3 [Vicia villosa]